MITVWNTRKNRLCLSAFAYPGGARTPHSAKMIYWQANSLNHQLLAVSCNTERILFGTNEAGMLLKTKDRHGKLASEAGMCMKTKSLSSLRREYC